jgi:alpha-N-arabinofuranosidase
MRGKYLRTLMTMGCALAMTVPAVAQTGGATVTVQADRPAR